MPMVVLLRVSVRLLLLVGLLFGGLATVFCAFPFMNRRRRDLTMKGWSRWLVQASGVRIVVNAALRESPLDPDTYGQMLVANHVSWLDIFVINAVAPSCFIAKSDIERWPLVGTLVASVGTLFLERGKRHAVHDMIRKAEHALRDGRRIAVFPEGTTGDGLRIMPFHANILEAAVHAQAAVVPIGIRYVDHEGGCASRAGGPIDFVGPDITFVASVLRIIQAPEIVAEVMAMNAVDAQNAPANKQRHALASAARERISLALALPLEDRLPEVVRDLRAAPR